MKIHQNICSLIVFACLLLLSYFNCIDTDSSINMQIQSKKNKVNKMTADELIIKQKIQYMNAHNTQEEIRKYKQQWNQKYRLLIQRSKIINQRNQKTEDKFLSFEKNLTINQQQCSQIIKPISPKLQLVAIQLANKRRAQLDMCWRNIDFTQNFYYQVMGEFIEQFEKNKRDPLFVSRKDFPFRFSPNQTLRNMYRPSEQFVRDFYAVYKEEENVQ